MAADLTEMPALPAVAGVRIGTACAGVRHADRPDLAVFEIAPGARATAVFTRNAFCAAPVLVARRHLAARPPRYLLVNSGNANAGTGNDGVEDALRTCEMLAAAGGCDPSAVLPFSTGVVGERLPVDRFEPAIASALAALDPGGWEAAARAMMTTDTRPKGAVRAFGSDAGSVVGIAKGAGMIRPDMATMLAFVATDVAVSDALLERALAQAVDASFNCITIDGDTSTNDACVLIATGAGGAASIESATDAEFAPFSAAVASVCLDLAHAIVRDGEGATKFVTVGVRGGADRAECRRVAYTIAHSPLVKTALFASDPNWGRILAAVGRSGVEGLDLSGVAIDLGEVRVVAEGAIAPGYREADGLGAMAGPEISIRVDLGRGDAEATVWTSDLSYDYVKINAEYRT